MDHAVSYVQGRGRARHAKSSFVMLDEGADRPASLLTKQEAEQHNVASSFVPENSTTNTKAIEKSQKSRERSAESYLLKPSEDHSVANLNIDCKKTKVVLEKNLTKTKGSQMLGAAAWCIDRSRGLFLAEERRRLRKWQSEFPLLIYSRQFKSLLRNIKMYDTQ